jgi:hypothetical protein
MSRIKIGRWLNCLNNYHMTRKPKVAL